MLKGERGSCSERNQRGFLVAAALFSVPLLVGTLTGTTLVPTEGDLSGAEAPLAAQLLDDAAAPPAYLPEEQAAPHEDPVTSAGLAELLGDDTEGDEAGIAGVLSGAGTPDVETDVSCMGGLTGLNCTAEDIAIAHATSIEILDDGCAYPGDTVTFSADFTVTTNATERYDIGLWFATDGDPNDDGATSGTCTVATPPYAPDPPWLNLDGDACGDINSTHNPLTPTVTITAVCHDHDANGQLDLPYCTSWDQQELSSCTPQR